jgi:hypothetical protein
LLGCEKGLENLLGNLRSHANTVILERNSAGWGPLPVLICLEIRVV